LSLIIFSKLRIAYITSLLILSVAAKFANLDLIAPPEYYIFEKSLPTKLIAILSELETSSIESIFPSFGKSDIN